MKPITILSQEFEVTTPYEEGHTITAAEAKSLNQTRAENIANNFRKRIKTALESEDPDGAMKALRKEFVAYDAEYEFTLASVGGGRSTLTPLVKMARKIARAWLNAQLKTKGITFKAYVEANGEENVKAKILEISENEAIVKQAEKQLKEAEKQAELQVDLTV